ncbi:MAG: (2Fe-2S)-binding protein [Balneolales bacterium]|nr:(2Fe-2S)-binding protein [Balneolales bacterium]
MAEIFIDNNRYEFEGPTKVLQFILDQGLELPFFCYHPSLSIPANCRQCYVEAGQPVMNRETGKYEVDEEGNRVIRFFPKLMTACSLDATDGMVIKTHVTSELVRRGQKDVLEFILINHPLDCPICDQAGECPLQIQTYKYGPEGSRFEHKKVHKPKRIQLGPRVVLDAERCINCTRCVRFTEEVSKSNQLTIVQRGDKNYPVTAPGTGFDDPYSINTVDICPVGALTSSDFRFKARVWEMSSTPSLDITNGKGCSVDVWTRDNLVMRITPRHNPHINDYWMPDAGREAYKIYNENRISRPDLNIDGDKVKSSWNNALLTIAENLDTVKPSEILVLGSGYGSVEDNYVLGKFFSVLGQEQAHFVPNILAGTGDNFLISDDQAPNTNGCRFLGFNELKPDSINKEITSGKYKTIIVLQEDIVGRNLITTQDLSNVFMVYLGTNNNDTSRFANVTIPVTTAIEHVGSYVNVDGRVQRSMPAKETVYTDRRINLEMSMGRLDHFGTRFDNWVSDKNKVDCIPAWEFFVRLAHEMNKEFQYNDVREIISEISLTNKHFSGVSYERMDSELGIDLVNKQKEELNLA